MIRFEARTLEELIVEVRDCKKSEVKNNNLNNTIYYIYTNNKDI